MLNDWPSEFLFLSSFFRTFLSELVCSLISRRAETLGLKPSRFQGDGDGGGWTAAPRVTL